MSSYRWKCSYRLPIPSGITPNPPGPALCWRCGGHIGPHCGSEAVWRKSILTSANYEALLEQYTPLLDDILRGERARDAGRHLPLIRLRQLRDHGLAVLPVP